MDIADIIAHKRDGLVLSEEEIRFFVNGVRSGAVTDLQSVALLMAIYIRGMDERETVALTLAMARAGDMADLSAIPGVKVDKHSTGGVGDLTTLVALPLAAACGVKVAKMSGRALGHTGGTLDKMESIPGCSIDIPMQRFVKQVQDIGCALIGQSGELAPVDKKLYALRDHTQTIGSLPLIVSSILSKKIAAGADAIVLDVKTGSGAFLPTLDASRELAREMVHIGALAGRRMVALVTDMDAPLGRCIGNAVEVREAIDILKGRREGRAATLCVEVAAHMVTLGLRQPYAKARQLVQKALQTGAGADKLAQLIAAQGGDARVVQDVSLLPQAPVSRNVRAGKKGYLLRQNAMALGRIAHGLGAGRSRPGDAVDPSVGIELFADVGDAVREGQTLATLYAASMADAVNAEKAVLAALEIGDEPAPARPLIFDKFEG